MDDASPGFPPGGTNTYNTYELDLDSPNEELGVGSPEYPASVYPAWYRPIVEAPYPSSGPATLPAVTSPPAATSQPSTSQIALSQHPKTSQRPVVGPPTRESWQVVKAGQ